RRAAQAESCPRSDAKLLGEARPLRRRKLGIREVLRQKQVLKPGVVQLQSAAAENPRRAGVHKKAGLDNVADDGNAILHVSKSLEVAARQSRYIAQGRNRKGAWRAILWAARIVIEGRRGGLFRNEINGVKGWNALAAVVVFPA